MEYGWIIRWVEFWRSELLVCLYWASLCFSFHKKIKRVENPPGVVCLECSELQPFLTATGSDTNPPYFPLFSPLERCLCCLSGGQSLGFHPFYFIWPYFPLTCLWRDKWHWSLLFSFRCKPSDPGLRTVFLANHCTVMEFLVNPRHSCGVYS